MKLRVLGLLSAFVLLSLTACAIGDSPEALMTQLPPVTLNAPPTTVFAGDCELTVDLNDWLQSTVFIRRDFLDTMYRAALMTAIDMRNEVVRLASLRDQLSLLAAPNCAVDAHLILVAAMTQAVDAFQAFANGDASSLGNTVEDVRSQVDTATAIQDELTLRLDQQYLVTQTAAAAAQPPP
jgi:hypothetical protein